MGFKQSDKPLSDHERLKLILEATTEGWWEWDLVRNTTYHSPKWYQMLGFSSENQPSSFTLWADLLHPDDREATIRRQEELMQTDDRWELCFRMKTAKGAYKDILSMGRVISRSPNGDPLKVVGIHQDITEMVRLQKQKNTKKIKEELLKGIFRVSQSSFKIYDFVKNKFINTYGDIAKNLGYEEDDFCTLIENFALNLVHPEDQKLFQDYVNQLKQKENDEYTEIIFRMKAKSGRYHWIKSRDAVFRRNEQGEPLQIIGSSIDITATKSMEARISQHLAYVERLSHRNAHSLRGPVATLLGLIQVMEMDNHDELSPLHLEYIKKTVMKMDEVIIELSNELEKRINEDNEGRLG